MALTRSEQMSRIRGKDTSPELILREALEARLTLAPPGATKDIVGRPDIYIPSTRTVIFIDGCFWHGCPDHYVRPRNRAEFWADKLASTVERDRRQTEALEAQGFRVVRAWEHEVFEALSGLVARIADPSRHPPSQDWRVVRVEVLDSLTDQERRHLVGFRDPSRSEVHDGRRSTRKWRRGKGSQAHDSR